LSETARWVARQLGYPRGFGDCTAIGFGDPIVAGVVFHNWNPEAGVIEVSAASTCRKWLTRDGAKQIGSYPFDQLECQAVVARHSEKNARARRIWRALGATEYIIPRLRGRYDAEVIAVLTVEDWRRFEGRL
jgi:RimJ/RimL family protein N-acetyltransferase